MRYGGGSDGIQQRHARILRIHSIKNTRINQYMCSDLYETHDERIAREKERYLVYIYIYTSIK